MRGSFNTLTKAGKMTDEETPTETMIRLPISAENVFNIADAVHQNLEDQGDVMVALLTIAALTGMVSDMVAQPESVEPGDILGAIMEALIAHFIEAMNRDVEKDTLLEVMDLFAPEQKDMLMQMVIKIKADMEEKLAQIEETTATESDDDDLSSGS